MLATHENADVAARVEGFADAAMRQAGFEREYTETRTYDRLITRLRESLAPLDLERLLAEGAAISREAAIQLALGATSNPIETASM